MRKLISSVVVGLILSIAPSLARAQAIGGDAMLPNNCRICGSVTYGQVTATTTFTSDASASKITIFSTMTITNPLPKNNDTITIECYGFMSPLAEIRTPVAFVNGTAISSRTVSIGTNGVTNISWNTNTMLQRNGIGSQARNCVSVSVGNSSNCSSSAAAPSLGSGISTLDETAVWTVTCGAGNVTAGSTSFLSARAICCSSNPQ